MYSLSILRANPDAFASNTCIGCFFADLFYLKNIELSPKSVNIIYTIFSRNSRIIWFIGFVRNL